MFNFIKKLFKKSPSKKIKRLPKSSLKKVASWITKDLRHHYCKRIVDGREEFGIIWETHHERYEDGSTKRYYILCADNVYYGKHDAGNFITLGKNPEEMVLIKYQNQKLRRKMKGQRNELKTINRTIEGYNRSNMRYYEENKQLKKDLLSKEELIKYLKIAQEDAAMGLLSEDTKQREYVRVILNSLRRGEA